MYSTGDSARPAGPGRPGSLGHRSLMDTSFTQRMTGRRRRRWKFGQVMVLLVFGGDKERERALKLKEILYSCFMLLNGAGIRGFAIRARGQDGQS